MPKVNEIKKGEVVLYNQQLLHVKQIEVQNPSARGAATLYKMRFRNVKTGGKVEERFKGDELLERIELFKRMVSYSYDEGDALVFMDDEDFTQYTIKKEDIAVSAGKVLFLPLLYDSFCSAVLWENEGSNRIDTQRTN